jgi:hypothetical protein
MATFSSTLEAAGAFALFGARLEPALPNCSQLK